MNHSAGPVLEPSAFAVVVADASAEASILAAVH